MRHVKLETEFCVSNFVDRTLQLACSSFSLNHFLRIRRVWTFADARVCDFVFREEFDERSSLSRCHKEREREKRLLLCTTININAFRRVSRTYCTTRADDGVQQYRSRVSCKWHSALYTSVSLFSVQAETNRGPERNGVLSALWKAPEYSRRPINKIQRRKERNNELHFPVRSFVRSLARGGEIFLSRLFSFPRVKKRGVALSHDFLPSYETAPTMRVSMSPSIRR